MIECFTIEDLLKGSDEFFNSTIYPFRNEIPKHYSTEERAFNKEFLERLEGKHSFVKIIDLEGTVVVRGLLYNKYYIEVIMKDDLMFAYHKVQFSTVGSLKAFNTASIHEQVSDKIFKLNKASSEKLLIILKEHYGIH